MKYLEQSERKPPVRSVAAEEVQCQVCLTINI